MDTTIVDDLIDRIANNQTTVDDYLLMRHLINTTHHSPKRTAAFLKLLQGHRERQQREGYSLDEETAGRRSGSAATVVISYARDRLYARGELILQTFYRLDDGTTDKDRSRRVHLAEQIAYFIEELWLLLFDQVVAAAQQHPASIAIHLDIPDQLGETRLQVRAIAEIVAYELGAVVTGTAPDPADCK